jgi:CBS domain-containing protein
MDVGRDYARPLGGSEVGHREYGPGSYGRGEFGREQRFAPGGGFSQGGRYAAAGEPRRGREGGREVGGGEGFGRGSEAGRGLYGEGQAYGAGSWESDRPGGERGFAGRGGWGGWEAGQGEPFGIGRRASAGAWGGAEERDDAGRWRSGGSSWAGWGGPGLSSGFGAERYDEGGVQTAAPRRQGRWQREALTAGEIMTRGIKAVTKQSTLQNVAQVMKDENCGIVPVVDESHKLLGVVTDRDIVIRALASDRGTAPDLTVGDVMTDDVEAVTPEEEVREVIELMGQKQIRRVPVVDRDDRLVGIIAMADIANRADFDEDLQEALERISSKRSFWNRLWS